MNHTKIAWATDQGPREKLEDNLGASQITLFPSETAIAVFGVYDGVGGNSGGEIASDLAARTVNAHLTASFASSRNGGGPVSLSSDYVLAALAGALEMANQTIVQQSALRADLRGMATTAVAGVIIDSQLYIGWLGDSRCYRFSGKTLQQITIDHSEVQLLVDAGALTPDQAKDHPLAHMINRYLGQSDNFEPATQMCHLSPGDTILLCTDGLTDVVTDSEIAAYLQACNNGQIPFDKLGEALVRQALNAQTHDNVTVLCCQYQPETIAEHQSLDLTMTGAYPVVLAQVLQRHTEEYSHEREKQLLDHAG